MALNGVIVYFPWGAGGNFVRNMITMDTRFEFLGDQVPAEEYPLLEDRYKFLLDYYQKAMSPETWLDREWAIRFRVHAKYYENGAVVYWNPEQLWAVDVHGGGDEVSNILYNRKLKCYDRFRIEKELRAEEISPWTIKQCEHIFLMPESGDDLNLMAEIYNSKNPTINQFGGIADMADRRSSNINAITTMTRKLKELETHLIEDSRSVHHFDFTKLYIDDGYTIVYQIVDKLDLQIPKEYIKTLHAEWLQSTRDVYHTYFNRKLPL
jgi:hypothetical protein